MTSTPPQPTPKPPTRDMPDKVVRATDLMGDRRMLLIEHAGERYQLRLTRNGKLILTK